MMSEEIQGPKLKELQYYCSGKIGWASEEERKRGAREEREKQETIFMESKERISRKESSTMYMLPRNKKDD